MFMFHFTNLSIRFIYTKLQIEIVNISKISAREKWYKYNRKNLHYLE